MVVNIINAIIWLVGIGIIWHLVSYIPMPVPIGTLVTVLFVLLAIVVILSLFGLTTFGVPRPYKGG